jgi:virginiamycin B lyase
MSSQKENVMGKFPSALGCLAALFIMTGCAANQSGGLVPASASADLQRGGPDTGSSVVEFKFQSSGIEYIASDAAGNEWFGTADPLAMVSIDEHTGAFTQYNLPKSYSGPFGLAMNPQHDVLWFTEPGSNSIGYMNLLNDTFGQFTIPTKNSNPEGISPGPGTAMWFTETGSGKIGRIDTITHAISEYKVPAPSEPFQIALGPDGALWFTNLRSIGRITTQGHVKLYSIGQNNPTGITAGPDGGVWFTGESDHGGGMVGRIDPATHVRKIAKYGAGHGGNEGITARDGDLWMTELQGNRIDRYDPPTHIVHSRPLPQGYSRPYGIALGADDQLWFANAGPMTTAIGKLCPDLQAGQCKSATDAVSHGGIGPSFGEEHH